MPHTTTDLVIRHAAVHLATASAPAMHADASSHTAATMALFALVGIVVIGAMIAAVGMGSGADVAPGVVEMHAAASRGASTLPAILAIGTWLIAMVGYRAMRTTPAVAAFAVHAVPTHPAIDATHAVIVSSARHLASIDGTSAKPHFTIRRIRA